MISLKGLNVKGLALFPTTEKVVLPCRHKYGAVATWSHCTDTYKPILTGHGIDAEINAFKYNLALTCFVSPYSDASYPTQIGDAFNTGRIRFGTYFVNWRWENPVTHAIENIPNFFDTIWGQLACDADLITQAQVGTIKAGNYPSLGNPMYTLTGGKYGYDETNLVLGTSYDVVTPIILGQYEWLNTLLGYYPSCGSYSYGLKPLINLLKAYYLAIRNSGYYYGYEDSFTRDVAMYNPTTTRAHDMMVDLAKTRAEAQALCQGYLQTAITNGGWYRDFAHWHNDIDTELAEYYAGQRATIGANDVANLDFGTAYEHYFLRDMVRRISLYTHGSEMVLVVDVKDANSLPLKDIETPLSVDLDLTGTILEGKEIKGVNDKGIRKLAPNHFIVEVPYAKADGFQAVTLQETLTPDYLDFALPSISGVTKETNTVTVMTNKLTNVVLFSVARGGQLYTATILKRDSVLSLIHAIDVTGIDFSTLDVYIGVITKEKQSILSNAYQW